MIIVKKYSPYNKRIQIHTQNTNLCVHTELQYQLQYNLYLYIENLYFKLILHSCSIQLQLSFSTAQLRFILTPGEISYEF